MIAALATIFPLHASDRVLSVLPLHHTFEFSCGLLLPFSRGARVQYVGELTSDRLTHALEVGRATAMVGVPALWQVIERRVRSQVDARGPVVKAAFDFAANANRALGRTLGIDAGKIVLLADSPSARRLASHAHLGRRRASQRDARALSRSRSSARRRLRAHRGRAGAHRVATFAEDAMGSRRKTDSRRRDRNRKRGRERRRRSRRARAERDARLHGRRSHRAHAQRGRMASHRRSRQARQARAALDRRTHQRRHRHDDRRERLSRRRRARARRGRRNFGIRDRRDCIAEGRRAHRVSRGSALSQGRRLRRAGVRRWSVDLGVARFDSPTATRRDFRASVSPTAVCRSLVRRAASAHRDAKSETQRSAIDHRATRARDDHAGRRRCRGSVPCASRSPRSPDDPRAKSRRTPPSKGISDSTRSCSPSSSKRSKRAGASSINTRSKRAAAWKTSSVSTTRRTRSSSAKTNRKRRSKAESASRICACRRKSRRPRRGSSASSKTRSTDK